LRFFAPENANAKENFHRINSAAAKQMLVYHHAYFPYPNLDHTNLLKEIRNLGNYPSNLRKVTVSNGNGSGAGLQLVDYSRLVYWRYRNWKVDIDGHTWAVPSGFWRKIFQGLFNIIGPHYKSQKISVKTQYAYDNCPGGTTATNGTIVSKVPNKYTPKKYTKNPNHSFIPLISALDLNTTDLNYNVASDPYILQKTPFDEVYFASENEEHVHVSQKTFVDMLNEITDFNLPPLSVSISGPSVLYADGAMADSESSEKEVEDGDIHINRPPPSASGTWTANASGGNGSYTYQWYVKSSWGSIWYKLYGETSKKLTKTIYRTTTFKVKVKFGSETKEATKYVQFVGGGEPPIPLDVDALTMNNHPNPFNPRTTIRFSVGKETPVQLTVYNIMGQKIKTLINGIVSKGEHQAVWNGKNQTGTAVASGIYIYELKAAHKRLLKKMIFAK
jgi:hypothetical protein